MHMVLWHLPLALSGQRWDASTRRLSFDLDLPTEGLCEEGEPSHYILPFFMAQASGHLSVPRCAITSGAANEQSVAIVQLLSGSLEDVSVWVSHNGRKHSAVVTLANEH